MQNQKLGRPFWVCIGIAVCSLVVVLINLAINNSEPVNKGWLFFDVFWLVVAIGLGALWLTQSAKDNAELTHSNSKNSN